MRYDLQPIRDDGLYVATIKFLDIHTCGSYEDFKKIKEYEFHIRGIEIKKILSIQNSDYDSLNYFTFENEAGYNYRNSTIVFTEFKTESNSNLVLHTIKVVHFQRGISCASDDFLPKLLIVGENYDWKTLFENNSEEEEKETDIKDVFVGKSFIEAPAQDEAIFILPNGQITRGAIRNYEARFSCDESTIYSLEVVQNKIDAKSDDSNIKFENLGKKDYNINTLNKEKEKENCSMFEKMFKGFNFGKIKDGSVKMSIYGPAFESYENGRENTYIAFDKARETYVDVSEAIEIDFDCIFEIPVAKNAIEENDFIRHQGRWCRVLSIGKDGRLEVEKIFGREIVTIIPTTNIFGFDFYQKLVVPFDFQNSVNAHNPFGNMLPLMFMSEKTNMSDLIMMNMVSGNSTFDFSSPFVMMAMAEDKSGSNNDIFKYMMLSQMMNAAPQKPEKYDFTGKSTKELDEILKALEAALPAEEA